ncbi:MAG: DUF2706 domain-containing protein [Pseudomonadota bacterium]
MRFIFLILFMLFFSGCTSYAPKDLKSPCVAADSKNSVYTPCIKRKVNDHWLI